MNIIHPRNYGWGERVLARTLKAEGTTVNLNWNALHTQLEHGIGSRDRIPINQSICGARRLITAEWMSFSCATK